MVEEGRKHIFPSGVTMGKVPMLLYINPPHVHVNNPNKTHWVTHKSPESKGATLEEDKIIRCERQERVLRNIY